MLPFSDHTVVVVKVLVSVLPEVLKIDDQDGRALKDPQLGLDKNLPIYRALERIQVELVDLLYLLLLRVLENFDNVKFPRNFRIHLVNFWVRV